MIVGGVSLEIVEELRSTVKNAAESSFHSLLSDAVTSAVNTLWLVLIVFAVVTIVICSYYMLSIFWQFLYLIFFNTLISCSWQAHNQEKIYIAVKTLMSVFKQTSWHEWSFVLFIVTSWQFESFSRREYLSFFILELVMEAVGMWIHANK